MRFYTGGILSLVTMFLVMLYLKKYIYIYMFQVFFPYHFHNKCHHCQAVDEHKDKAYPQINVSHHCFNVF